MPKVLNNLKGVVSRRVFEARPALKFDLKSEHLWTREYQARVLPGAEAVIAACRYVEGNPTRIGLPRQSYPWLAQVAPLLARGITPGAQPAPSTRQGRGYHFR